MHVRVHHLDTRYYFDEQVWHIRMVAINALALSHEQ